MIAAVTQQQWAMRTTICNTSFVLDEGQEKRILVSFSFEFMEITSVVFHATASLFVRDSSVCLMKIAMVNVSI